MKSEAAAVEGAYLSPYSASHSAEADEELLDRLKRWFSDPVNRNHEAPRFQGGQELTNRLLEAHAVMEEESSLFPTNEVAAVGWVPARFLVLCLQPNAIQTASLQELKQASKDLQLITTIKNGLIHWDLEGEFINVAAARGIKQTVYTKELKLCFQCEVFVARVASACAVYDVIRMPASLEKKVKQCLSIMNTYVKPDKEILDEVQDRLEAVAAKKAAKKRKSRSKKSASSSKSASISTSSNQDSSNKRRKLKEVKDLSSPPSSSAPAAAAAAAPPKVVVTTARSTTPSEKKKFQFRVISPENEKDSCSQEDSSSLSTSEASTTASMDDISASPRCLVNVQNLAYTSLLSVYEMACRQYSQLGETIKDVAARLNVYHVERGIPLVKHPKVTSEEELRRTIRQQVEDDVRAAYEREMAARNQSEESGRGAYYSL
jgi:hypothetical protein